MATVLVFNSNEDVLESIIAALVQKGHDPTSCLVTPSTMVTEVAQFIKTDRPEVVVYDLLPPFVESMRSWRNLCAQPDMPDVAFVLTTTWPHLKVEEPRCAVAFLRDTFSFDEVVSAVDLACSRAT